MKLTHLSLLLTAAALSFATLHADDTKTPQDNTPLEPNTGRQGHVAPPLMVQDWIQLPEGKERLELTDFDGKYVLILFFQETCPASQAREFPVLKRLVDKFGTHPGVQFLAIQTTFQNRTDNTFDKLEVNAKRHGLNIPFGHLPKLPGVYNLNEAYNTGGTPWWVVITPDRKVEYNGHELNAEEAEKILNERLAKQ